MKTSDAMPNRTTKVSIIGAGMVGASLAYSLIVERVVGEVILVDLNKERARGEAMDIQHALPFGAPTKVEQGDYADCANSDVIVVTAGAPQKPGESRLSLAGRNCEVYKDIIPRIAEVAGEAVLLIISNPVDILAYAAIKFSALPWTRVIGSGTILDTARFRYELSAKCGIDPRNVHAYIIGEHGDTEVPLWSTAKIAGVEFRHFCRLCGGGCPTEELDALFQRVRNAAYDIIRLKGSTYYAIALGATRMIEAVLRDQNTVMTASTLLQGEYGIRDVCLSLPIVIGRAGIRRVIEAPVAHDEHEALQHSARVLRSVLDQLGL